MTIEELMQQLIQEESNEIKKAIFETLYKCSNQVFFSTNTTTDYPFLSIKGNELLFTFKHADWGNVPYLFTDDFDIHTMLHHLLYENMSIFISYEEILPFTEEELWEKIDEALQNGDQESFSYYARFVKK